jgi:hypothetical protein
MLRNMSDLEGYTIHAVDGNIGHLKDCYFDDESWVIRYLVVDAGNWLLSRKVLISPIAIGEPNWRKRELPVSITREQVKNSPDLDTDKPVSRQYEIGYLGYYGYPFYWDGAGLWGQEAYPNMMAPVFGGLPELETDEHDDHHLRSCVEIVNYHMKAIDGDIGHVKGLLIDEESWAIRYLIVDTGNWWLGHQVLIAPQWITEINWPNAKVSVKLTRQAIQDAPLYDRTMPLGRAQENEIHEHFSVAGYWAEEVEREVEITQN